MGISPRSFHTRARAEGWTDLQRGVWLVPGAVRSFPAEVAGALLAAGDRVAATGVTALHLHGVVDDPPSALHMAVPADRARPALRGVDDVVRTGTLVEADVTEVVALRTVVVPWALLHAGRQLSVRRVLDLMVSARQRGLLSDRALEDVLRRCGPAKGAASLRRGREALVVDAVDSILELDARRFVRRNGHQPFPSPFPFRCPDRRIIHLDLAFPAFWFAYECDSPQARAGGRAFHTDRTRWTQARRGGWEIGWITRQRLRNDPRGILDELADAAARVDPDRPPPVLTPCRRATCRVCPGLRGR
ncbi:MAG: hypothetical protein M3276_05650 [Actinomycetota bacterium]|nr:hypothetical protein [Actinomycetota bacterium]